MPPATALLPLPEALYPDSDGLPMADNTIQYRYITTIKGGLEAQYDARPDVFVAGDLLWYAREGDPSESAAPDTMVVFGRPKGDRRSYQQWREGGIPPQVVFEILSPNHTPPEMDRKLAFYERNGVDEYYLFDPDTTRLAGWLRGSWGLQVINRMPGWVSPRLGVRFQLEGDELVLYGTDGRAFVSYEELVRDRNRAEEAQAFAEWERNRAEEARLRERTERERAEQERARAEQERDQFRAEQESAERERDQARAERERERERAARLVAQLRALGLDPDG
jgi:Uma2 family endonuclease